MRLQKRARHLRRHDRSLDQHGRRETVHQRGETPCCGFGPRAIPLFFEMLNCSRSLFSRKSGRKTGFHLSWICLGCLFTPLPGAPDHQFRDQTVPVLQGRVHDPGQKIVAMSLILGVQPKPPVPHIFVFDHPVGDAVERLRRRHAGDKSFQFVDLPPDRKPYGLGP